MLNMDFNDVRTELSKYYSELLKSGNYSSAGLLERRSFQNEVKTHVTPVIKQFLLSVDAVGINDSYRFYDFDFNLYAIVYTFSLHGTMYAFPVIIRQSSLGVKSIVVMKLNPIKFFVVFHWNVKLIFDTINLYDFVLTDRASAF